MRFSILIGLGALCSCSPIATEDKARQIAIEKDGPIAFKVAEQGDVIKRQNREIQDLTLRTMRLESTVNSLEEWASKR